jgi:hypothetical protein
MTAQAQPWEQWLSSYVASLPDSRMPGTNQGPFSELPVRWRIRLMSHDVQGASSCS